MHEGSRIKAVVRWFDPDKGFGFVTPQDGSPDAFLHASALSRAGLYDIPEGTVIVCTIVPGGKGPQVNDIVEVQGPASQPVQPAGHDDDDDGEVAGTVKWFKTDKGFGFVVADDGGKDVFVHSSVLRRGNLATLPPGQRVLMRVRDGAKGREATTIALL